MSRLLLTFYGDDFTGSTDALEQLSIAGVPAMLFIDPPSPAQLKRFPRLQAVGIAGTTRSMTPEKMAAALRPALKKLKALGARHCHYKVCSTFDSSPALGSIGRVIEIAAKLFRAPFVPVLAAAPALGRYTVFGNHFARYGIGSQGEIHRLDRHPAISRHPVTPMTEADLRLHLAKQTNRTIALFDILKLSLPENECLAAFKTLQREKPDIILFDGLSKEHLEQAGRLMDGCASAHQPLFSVGSSGIETALATVWHQRLPKRARHVRPVGQLLVASGSCSPVTQRQIKVALKSGFREIALNAAALLSAESRRREIAKATAATAKFLADGRSVIVHTTGAMLDARTLAGLANSPAGILGAALGEAVRGALAKYPVTRICLAGGDTSGFAARALGIEAVEMIAPLTPGAPVCRAVAPGSPADRIEIVFKGGQVGVENYFNVVKNGKPL
jgi:uncharacterized protein YgbK (DUF1537 family)